MEINTIDNKESLTVNEKIFDYVYHENLIHQAVIASLNKARSGNSAQKSRSEVSGSGKKPWRQKGTGRARSGCIRSPIWRSGGVTFAGKKRDYTQKVNKQMWKKAWCSVISELYRTGNLIVVSEFQCVSHKTKDFVKKMEEMQLKQALIILSEVGEKEHFAARNLIHFDICDLKSLELVELLRFKQVVITKNAIRKLEEQLQ